MLNFLFNKCFLLLFSLSWRAQLSQPVPFLLQQAILGAPGPLSPTPLRSLPPRPTMGMTESGASSPELQETHQVDINELLDQDEQEIRDFSKKSRVLESENDQPDEHNEVQLEDDGDESDEDSEEAAAEEEARNFYNAMDGENPPDEARPPSPAPSPNPYAHPQITDTELDFDWDEEGEVREALKAKRRKKAGKLACVGLSSTASKAEIEWCLRYYDKGCIWARPHP